MSRWRIDQEGARGRGGSSGDVSFSSDWQRTVDFAGMALGVVADTAASGFSNNHPTGLVTISDDQSWNGHNVAKLDMVSGVGSNRFAARCSINIGSGGVSAGDVIHFRVRAYFLSTWSFEAPSPPLDEGADDGGQIFLAKVFVIPSALNHTPPASSARNFFGFYNALDNIVLDSENGGGVSDTFPVTILQDQWQTWEWKITINNFVDAENHRMWADGVHLGNSSDELPYLNANQLEYDSMSIFEYWNGGFPKNQVCYIGEVDIVKNPVGLPLDAGGRPHLGTAQLSDL